MSDFRWDLKRPCKHCPFRTDDTAIRFAARSRAEEIEESAYRNGFPCHQHAEFADEEEDGEYRQSGYHAADDGSSQHCAGALLMYLMSGSGNVPYEYLDEEEQERVENRLDWSAPVFESEEDFLEANS